jgi:hypothetical protein
LELLAFVVVAGALYLGADWLLDRIERARGARFEHRSLIFFALLLVAALVSFSLLERLMAG